jgi:hypothetical protein
VPLQRRKCLVAPLFLWKWRGAYDCVSKRDWLKLTPDLTTRWATGNDNFVYSCLWDFKSSFTCHKILQHGTFPFYFPSERKVCCGFVLPLKIHRLGQVLNPQPFGPVASTLTTTPPRRQKWSHYVALKQWSATGVPRHTGVPVHGIVCATNIYLKLYLDISTFTALNLLYCNKFAGSIHNGSLLHSRLNTQLLITINNSSRILTHV